MASLTASLAASNVSPRAVHAGVNSVTVRYDSGTTTVDASKTFALFCKIPHGATILDVIQYHSSSAATCPMDIGIRVGTTTTQSAFVSQATIGAVSRATIGVPYTVSCSDDAVTQHGVIIGNFTPGTAGSSVNAQITVLYTMDE